MTWITHVLLDVRRLPNKLRQLCTIWMREFHPEVVAKIQAELGMGGLRKISSELSSIYKKVTEETTP